MFTFLSTPSARRATVDVHVAVVHNRISIHALREEGDQRDAEPEPGMDISIHALREEGDLMVMRVPPRYSDFYPRPPRGGRRPGQFVLDCINLFLSTPSARRATLFPRGLSAIRFYFYPRPPRGGRRQIFGRLSPYPVHFYPRPPRGGRHMFGENDTDYWAISIHALREEGDRQHRQEHQRA